MNTRCGLLFWKKTLANQNVKMAVNDLGVKSYIIGYEESAFLFCETDIQDDGHFSRWLLFPA